MRQRTASIHAVAPRMHAVTPHVHAIQPAQCLIMHCTKPDWYVVIVAVFAWCSLLWHCCGTWHTMYSGEECTVGETVCAALLKAAECKHTWSTAVRKAVG